jgi:hypothetical protein
MFSKSYNIAFIYMKSSRITKIVIGAACILLILSLTIFKQTYANVSVKEIEDLTNLWIREVTERNNPEAISKLFCTDGNLVGTVSQVKRNGEDIKKYFDYFAKLPEIRVVAKEYNISKITDNVYLNTAFIKWKWKGLEDPITARMTFIFRNKCIFQLHSSALPDLNKDLYIISNTR